MNRRAAWLPIVLGLALARVASAAQRPRVAVVFRLQEVTYQTEIDSVRERPLLEDSVATTLVLVLADRFRFLSFGGGSPAPFRLVVALDRRDRGTHAAVVDVGFHASLIGPDSLRDSLDVYWAGFRPAESALQGLGTPDQLLAEIRSRLSELRDADWARLGTELLSTIPVADTGAVWVHPLRWIIPLQRRQICLDRSSVLTVRNVVSFALGSEEQVVTVEANGEFNPPGAIQPQLERMRGGILGEARGPVTFATDNVRVMAVYVSDYRFSRADCLDPVSPLGGGTP
jgi:hypothetical protein